MKRAHGKTTSTKTFKKKARTGDYQKGRELAKVPKQELKAFDIALQSLANQTVGNPPVFQTLNTVINGAELYQRVGRKIYMKSLHIRGVIQATAASVEQAGRIIIYYDSQPNGVAATIASLLQDSNAASGTSWASEINLTNRQRFKILRDYQVMLGDVTNIAGVAEVVPDPIKNTLNIEMFIKLKGLEAIFNGTNGGTIADITSGAIGITFVGNSTTDGNYALSYTSRLRFYD